MDVFIIYQFCTFGGVERVLLNRAKVYKENNLDVKITAGYLFDSGALDSFKIYIKEHHLEDYISAKILNQGAFINLSEYDAIFVIDTPQVFDQIKKLKNVYIECHTHYSENRQYLGDIPSNINGIIVPSIAFKKLIQGEFPHLPHVFVLPNPIPTEFFETGLIPVDKYFNKRLITYLGRLDDLKNYSEALNLFDLYVDQDEIMFTVIGNGVTQEENIHKLQSKHILRKTLLRDQIGFDQVPYLIKLVKHHRGVYFSPSKGESFGLSVAEFISGGVPVLLSDIDAHRDLVENDEDFLYSLGDVQLAKVKMDLILENWEAMSHKVAEYSNKFRAKTFITAWDKFMATIA